METKSSWNGSLTGAYCTHTLSETHRTHLLGYVIAAFPVVPQDRRPDLKPNPPATLLLPAILEQHIELLTLYRRYEPLSRGGHCYTDDAKHALKYIEENVLDFDFHLTF